MAGYVTEVIYRAGHRRWKIENKAFRELTQDYDLERCSHREPTSILVQMLILMPGFVLFMAFAQLDSKLVYLGQVSCLELTQQLNLALEQDLPRELWFDSG